MTKEKKYLVSIILWSIFWQICWNIICCFWQKRKRKSQNIISKEEIEKIVRKVRAEERANFKNLYIKYEKDKERERERNEQVRNKIDEIDTEKKERGRKRK